MESQEIWVCIIAILELCFRTNPVWTSDPQQQYFAVFVNAFCFTPSANADIPAEILTLGHSSKKKLSLEIKQWFIHLSIIYIINFSASKIGDIAMSSYIHQLQSKYYFKLSVIYNCKD